ncbi:MAG TPA: phosphoribosylanthranilate isomerase [Bryobacterales bacterium]|nr:phosphoribosylanthranilate isomerase [Bryobacterales bacterium]
MNVKVKICGIRDEETLEAVIDAGADFFGLVFFPRSPRHVDMDTAARLAARARGRISIVALTVDADDSLLREIARKVRPDFLQLHGSETLEQAIHISKILESTLIKAFRIRSVQDLEAARDWHERMAFPLFDAWVDETRAQGLPGGTGHAFDWSLLNGWDGDFMLAGGLTPENVGEAIRVTGAPMVDVSSGVERVRGVKDPERIRAFVRAARAAAR